MKEQVEQRHEAYPSVPDSDPATGLPRQDAAKALMRANLKAGKQSYVATLVVSRMQSIQCAFWQRIG